MLPFQGRSGWQLFRFWRWDMGSYYREKQNGQQVIQNSGQIWKMASFALDWLRNRCTRFPSRNCNANSLLIHLSAEIGNWMFTSAGTQRNLIPNNMSKFVTSKQLNRFSNRRRRGGIDRWVTILLYKFSVIGSTWQRKNKENYVIYFFASVRNWAEKEGFMEVIFLRN